MTASHLTSNRQSTSHFEKLRKFQDLRTIQELRKFQELRTIQELRKFQELRNGCVQHLNSFEFGEI